MVSKEASLGRTCNVHHCACAPSLLDHALRFSLHRAPFHLHRRALLGGGARSTSSAAPRIVGQHLVLGGCDSGRVLLLLVPAVWRGAAAGRGSHGRAARRVHRCAAAAAPPVVAAAFFHWSGVELATLLR